MKNFTIESVKKIGKYVLYYDNLFLLCSDYTQTPTNKTVFHTHDFYEIQYIFDGEGVEFIENKSYHISTGSIVLFAPGVRHMYYSSENLSFVILCFYPTKTQIQNISFTHNKPFILDEHDRIEYETTYFLLQRILKYSGNTFRPQFCFQFMLDILNTFSLKDISSEKQWTELLLYLAQNYATVRLEEAAKFFGYSVGYFSRIFKKRYGKSFLQYIDSMKIEKAKVLLKNRQNKISAISDIVGFSHQTRFHKIFKKITGTTPMEYRHNLLQEKSSGT